MARNRCDQIASLAVGLALLGLTACSNLQGGTELGDERSFDGLVRVKSSRSRIVWIRPDFDLSGYTQVKLEGAGIEYRPVRRGGERGRFPLSEAAKERLESIMKEAFQRALNRSERFQPTDKNGPSVLLVWAGLFDVVSFVPPRASARGNVFLQSVGEATLVVELRDSQSNATLARMIDRRAASRQNGGFPSNSVSNMAEVRRLADSWARLVRERLDAAPSLSGGVVVDGKSERP
jgi:hypothetical protein